MIFSSYSHIEHLNRSIHKHKLILTYKFKLIYLELRENIEK